MPTINLTANGRDQELILAYLTENASDVLADKINNGVPPLSTRISGMRLGFSFFLFLISLIH